jgi:Cep192 domain 4
MRQGISVGALLALLLSLGLVNASSLAQAASLGTNSSCLQSTTGSVQLANSLSLSFPSDPANGNTIVVMVVYTNAANAGTLGVSGLGATWASIYAPAFQAGLGIAFFSGTFVSGTQSTITVNAAQPDNLVVVAQAWTNLSITVDTASEAIASGQSQNPTITVNTSNANDVIFNIVGFFGTALPSPPSAGFLDMGLVPSGQFPPNVTGGLGIVDTAGFYTNTFSTSAPVTWLSAAVALVSVSSNATFTATPLTDFSSGEVYLSFFPGLLYNDSNTPDAGHDNDGTTAASLIQPLDRNGNVAADGKIGWVGIGGANLTAELCRSDSITADNSAQCDPDTFFDQARKLANLNPNLVLADCAVAGISVSNWLNLGSGGWTGCLGKRLPAYGLTPAQVEIVAISSDDGLTQGQTLAAQTCPATPRQGVDPDACVYESNLANLVRLLKAEFPNLQQIFLQPPPYCGYGPSEPLCYENGFALKWLIQSQIDQVEGTPNLAGANDALAGDVSYASAAWMGWGAYLWGAGATPRLDGQSWPPNNFEVDGSSTSQCRFYGINCGRQHDADLMMAFYSTSPYTTPWFLTTPAAFGLTVSSRLLNFGKQEFGSIGQPSAAKTIRVRNPAGSKRPTITVGTPTTTGDTNGNYEVTGGTCTAGLELAPGQSCTITVNYSPLGPAPSTGTLTIPNNGSVVQTVALKGTGKIADVTVSPRTLNFAKTGVSQSSNAKIVTLKNNNRVPFTLAPLIIGGLNPGDFTQTSLCPQTLHPQDSCTISVTFTPSATGTRKADIAVTASLASTSITLSGTGK